MKTKTPEQKLSVRFPLSVLEELRKLAKAHQRSLNGEVIWGLLDYIQRQKEKQGS